MVFASNGHERQTMTHVISNVFSREHNVTIEHNIEMACMETVIAFE